MRLLIITMIVFLGFATPLVKGYESCHTDQDIGCKYMASQGQCSNIIFRMYVCPRSCNQCKQCYLEDSKSCCQDDSIYCEFWANSGFCTSPWMHKVCPFSCNKCFKPLKPDPLDDAVAQAICTSIMTTPGHMFAVRRAIKSCSSALPGVGGKTCAGLCLSTNGKDYHKLNGVASCVESLKVYHLPNPNLGLLGAWEARPASLNPNYFLDHNKLGMKTRRYMSCTVSDPCGPNYCCCQVTP